MKRRWKLLIAVVVMLVLLMVMGLLWLQVQHDGSQKALDSYKAELRAKGEKLELSEVRPQRVPEEENGAPAVLAALNSFVAASGEYTNRLNGMRMVAPGRAMVGWAQPEPWLQDNTNASWNYLAALYAADEQPRQALHAIFQQPKLDFDLDYSRGFFMQLAHLAPLRVTNRRLQTAALFELHAGDTAAAATNIFVMLALARGLQDERAVISQLVRLAMLHDATGCTWEFLQATNITDGQLSALQDQWQRQEQIGAMERTLQFERAALIATMTRTRAANQNVDEMLPWAPPGVGIFTSNWVQTLIHDPNEVLESTRYAGARYLWRTQGSYQDELYILKQYQLVLELWRGLVINPVFEPALANVEKQFATLKNDVRTEADEDWLAKALEENAIRQRFLFVPGELAEAVHRIVLGESQRQLTFTAIAIRRYQLRHGRLPAELSMLSPEFLPAVPRDPIDGKPLRYRLKDNGSFLLYSIGRNNVDDGGDPTPLPASAWEEDHYSTNSWLRGRDWVWPQPATPAEIQKYWDDKTAP